MKGFSLIELLISLIIISIITAAFVPIMTKKTAKSSMTVKVADSKRGLEIYTNPGTYSFSVPEAIDKIYISGAGGGGGGAGGKYSDAVQESYKADTTFRVPYAVNEITLDIYGAGGGGGGGYGRTGSETCPSEYITLPKMADNGRDLCYFNKNMNSKLGEDTYGVDLIVAKAGAGNVSGTSVCFIANGTHLGTAPNPKSGSTAPNKRMACSQKGAASYCSCYLLGAIGWNPVCQGHSESEQMHIGRLLKYSEAQRALAASTAANGFKYFGPNYLDLYISYNSYNSHTTPGDNYLTKIDPGKGCTFGTNSNNPRCNYSFPLLDGEVHWSAWSSNINLNPVDQAPQVNNTINSTEAGPPWCVYEVRNWYPYGASGGASGSHLNQTISVLPNDTLTITIGKGGQGGTAGSNGRDGGQTKVVHKRNGTTLATYYANGGIGGNKASLGAFGAATNYIPTCSTPGGNCSVTVRANDGNGYSGSESAGGNGAGETSGGTPDALAQAGAANSAFGGGGGFCARGTRNPSLCQKGGQGGSGRVDITYKRLTPGGGGGAGASAGLNNSGVFQEIEYSIAPGSRIVFSVGKGGDGGVFNQKGYSGTATTIMEDEIIFNPGSGGNFGTGGTGGTLKINTTKARLLNIDSSVNNYGKGLDGEGGQLIDNSNNYLNYGLDGGTGGATFLGYFGGCGAGIITDTNTERNCKTGGSKDGLVPKIHNAVTNKYGGAGGGGGSTGSGGSGADGYLRIRWGD